MPTPSWAPTPAKCAAVLRTYTRGSDTPAKLPASELGRWTDTTRPTLAEVQESIEIACGDVYGHTEGRDPCTIGLEMAVASAALYRACQLICLSHYPAAARGEDNVFDKLGVLFDLDKLGEKVVAHCPLNPDDPDDDGGTLAPKGKGVSQPLIGRETDW